MRSITPTVKNLMIINLLLFAINAICQSFLNFDFALYFSLHYIGSPLFNLYQLFTYMFVQVDVLSLFFTLLSLYFIGTMLEQQWGAKRFLNFYIFSGVIAGIFLSIIYMFFAYKLSGNFIMSQDEMVRLDFYPQIQFGSRWVMFSIWTAMALIYPNLEVLLYFIIPLKMKYIWLIFVIIEVIGAFGSSMQDSYSLYIMFFMALTSYLLVRYYLGYKINRF